MARQTTSLEKEKGDKLVEVSEEMCLSSGSFSTVTFIHQVIWPNSWLAASESRVDTIRCKKFGCENEITRSF
jgi:hypothetical protein